MSVVAVDKYSILDCMVLFCNQKKYGHSKKKSLFPWYLSPSSSHRHPWSVYNYVHFCHHPPSLGCPPPRNKINYLHMYSCPLPMLYSNPCHMLYLKPRHKLYSNPRHMLYSNLLFTLNSNPLHMLYSNPLHMLYSDARHMLYIPTIYTCCI